MKVPFKIGWHSNRENRPPFYESSLVSPDPAFIEPIGFPPPWPNRPWIFAIMVESANGVVAWERKDEHDDPVAAILGITAPYTKPMTEARREERTADKLLMRFLRTIGDTSVGAKTVRTQTELVQTPREEGKDNEPELQPLYEALYRFREARGLSRHPLNVIYSPSGRLDLTHVIFNTPGVKTAVVTTLEGEILLKKQGADDKGVFVIAERNLGPVGLSHAHRILYDHGVRYLDCEGGETILRALHEAHLLDEVFVTTSDVVVDKTRHEGILQIFDFKKEGAELIAEGKVYPEGAYTFRRWRFNRR